jgi:hypothetical protein
LFSNPKAGAVIQETGGRCKVRWAIKGKGKSGGVRVTYFYVTAAAQIRLIAIYKRGIKDDLNAAEKGSEETQRKLDWGFFLYAKRLFLL